MNGTIFDIKEFAVFDGPGIRTTVFLKGCPLHCPWCHNPEGLRPEPEIMVSRAACTHCGACTRVCKHPEGCVLCGDCIPVCRERIRKIAGTVWEADALAARLKKDADVYALSGGGVTFSGGEPLLQWPFVSAVIDRLDGISAAVETSGFARDEVFDEMMRKCAPVLMDWKISDPVQHERLLGVPQEVILRHLLRLAAGNVPFILRMPIIPGINDTPEHFRTAAELVAGSSSLLRIDILPYQRAAGAKYEMVGRTYRPDFDESAEPRFYTEFFERENLPFRIF